MVADRLLIREKPQAHSQSEGLDRVDNFTDWERSGQKLASKLAISVARRLKGKGSTLISGTSSC